eukprot:1843140-Prorocentrum_lima.AAC.1
MLEDVPGQSPARREAQRAPEQQSCSNFVHPKPEDIEAEPMGQEEHGSYRPVQMKSKIHQQQ